MSMSHMIGRNVGHGKECVIINTNVTRMLELCVGQMTNPAEKWWGEQHNVVLG